MSAGRNLLARINAFLREANMPHSVFGRAAAHDPRLVADLRNGREPGAELIERIDAYMYRWRNDREAGRVFPVGDRRFRPMANAA